MKKWIAVLLAASLLLPLFTVGITAKSESTYRITDLQVNNTVNPAGVDDDAPVFSWKMESDALCAAQTAYRLTVTAANSLVTALQWDSGIVESAVSTGIVYEGTPLKPATRYLWYVTVWNEQGNQIKSEPAYFETGLMDEHGFDKATWICAPVAENTAEPVLRKSFAVEGKQVASARLYTAAIGVYDLYLNGQRVGTETESGTRYDELKPGWTDYRKRVLYNTYDVTTLLSRGENAVAVQLASGWALGTIAGGIYGFTNTAFIGRMDITYSDGSRESLYTDTSWQYTRSGALLHAELYDGDTFDASRPDVADFSAAGNAQGEWQSVIPFTEFKGVISTAAVGAAVRVREELTQTPISYTVYNGTVDNGTDYGKIKMIATGNTVDTVSIKSGETVIVDMGQNIVGWPEFRLYAPKGTKVTVHFAEMLNDSGEKSRGNDGPEGSLYTANYRTALSTLTYYAAGLRSEIYHPTLTYYGYRYLSFTANQDMTLYAVEGQIVGADTEETGYIKTNDQSVNQLFSNILWGQRGNYFSAPTDCPQRNERLGWTGDTEIFANAAAYNADIQSYMAKWLQDARDSQTNGQYTDVIPAVDYVGAGNAAWGDAGIIVPYTVYLMYGDTQIIQAMYDSMEDYMAWMEQSRGYAGANTAYGDWLSYQSNNQEVKDCIAAAYYAYDCQLMVVMSNAVGKGDRAAHYQARYESAKAEFNRLYMANSGLLLSCNATQTCYLVALRADLFKDDITTQRAVQALVKNIKDNGNQLGTGFIGTGIIQQTLSDMGRSDVAYTLLLQRSDPSWLYSVDQGATTVWERWNSYTKENGFGPVEMNSFNHYAYGAVAEWMYSDMLGISADTENPGFGHFILKPQPDTRAEEDIPDNQTRITDVKGFYNSKYGKITAEWHYNSENFTYTVTVPANTGATVYIPVANHDGITVNGVAMDTLADVMDGWDYKGYENGCAVFEVKAGSYAFKASTVQKNDHNFAHTAQEALCLLPAYKTDTCTVCGYTVTAEGTAAHGHIDENKDYRCDTCGDYTVTEENCPCLCHCGGFKGFIYQIQLFFWKLFKIHPVCHCGKHHY